MLKKNKNSKLKKWIEFWCVCAIIGCISGFTWSDNMVMNIIVIITSALILAYNKSCINILFKFKKVEVSGATQIGPLIQHSKIRKDFNVCDIS